jgi:EAL domain-containing protein (putative c-di-GMP-specific phosphodiesterase class I)
VALSDGRVVAVEALVRWEHPFFGLVPPNEFIPLAEETGLIVGLGRWVLEEACRRSVAWQGDPALSQLDVAVNLSGRQLRGDRLDTMIAAILRDTSMPADRLILEVTESLLVEDDADAIRSLRAVRDLGVRLAVDDFGTGYSSLSALKRFPIDFLKVDRSFVDGLPNDDDAGTIVWAVVRLGHNLNLTVVAEGIETAEQLAALREYGCDQGQGFLFSRPVAEGQLREAVSESARRSIASAVAAPVPK